MYGSVIRSCSLPTLLFYFVALFGSIAVPYVTVSQPASAIRSLYLNGYNKAPFVRICGGTGWGVVDGKRSREKQKEQETLEQQTGGIHCPCRPDYQQQLQSLSKPAKTICTVYFSYHAIRASCPRPVDVGALAAFCTNNAQRRYGSNPPTL